ncbi:MAG: DNA-3-methyladenine glycosylase I [Deltaproteobacteria bacterium]|nr:MAG: DNA-3-methyladenine glycosylase I [Deltaproteobacteria bacterium]
MKAVVPSKGRCAWVDLTKPDYVAYHDEEWGVPLHDDRRIFEFLLLETAQAGLSWYTVLRKREAYRAAFAGFDPGRVARYTPADVDALLQNRGIIRNRRKIEAAISNARRFLEVAEAFGSFDAYVWRFVDGKPILHAPRTAADCPTTSPEAKALCRDLKQRGFRFVGPTVVYAHMQATGMVNDHLLHCFRRSEIVGTYR